MISELDYLIEQLGEAIDREDKPMFEYWSQQIDDYIGDIE
jgi:hypothetical protein